MKTKSCLFFILNLIVAVSFFYFNMLPIPKEYYNLSYTCWNFFFGFVLSILFFKRDTITYYKSFSIKWFILGLSLTSFCAYLGNYIYSTYVSLPTINNFLKTSDLYSLLTILPLLVLGEEIISINLTTALERIGLNFWIASFVIAVLFAFWHINSFGFVPIQLLMIIAPIRLALNYTFKNSVSIWTITLVHYVFNILVLTMFYN